MTNDSDQKTLETEIETQRASIAELQERVKELVRRREDTNSQLKTEAIDELKRTIDTIKEDRAKTTAGTRT